MKATERRQALLEYLCEVRRTTITNIQEEFNVSRSTAKRDVFELSLSYPVNAQQGNNGGVYLSDDYYLGKSYLSKEQQELLESLADKVSQADKIILDSIIKKFGKKIAR